jgi:exodeoxyribonuclease V gamma subunit
VVSTAPCRPAHAFFVVERLSHPLDSVGPLTLHRYAADRAGPLAARLAEVLNEVPPDPLTPEWLATPSEGMRRWVMLELASRLGAADPDRADGICANVRPAFADSLRRSVLEADGVDADRDPWSPQRLAWPVLALLADEVGATRMGVPRPGDASRYGLARQIADHFDRYHLHRAAMVRAWAEGHDVDALGAPLQADMTWQPRLWRAVRQVIGQSSAPERWPGLLERVREGRIELDLPPRLLLFGFSLLPAGDVLELLSALGTTRDVHLFLLEPAAYDPRELLKAAGATVDGLRLRTDDGSASVAAHPLLRSWGRPQRETAVLLADSEAQGLPSAERVGRRPGEEEKPNTLLGCLQADIAANRAPAEDFDPSSSDRSVQFHACYGPARQVTALRDALLHLLADDRSLREEDIVVLCPALDRFASLIESVLGPSAPASGAVDPPGASRSVTDAAPALRYRIVDQSVRSDNEVVEATLTMLDLVSGRFEAPAVVDFLTRHPVRERFGFDEDDVAAIDRWVVGTRVRWGLDPDHRRRFGLPTSVTSNTWQAALDRLLMGSVVGSDDLAMASGGVVPYAIEGGAVSGAGRLAEAIWVLQELAAATATTRPVTEWVTMVRDAVRSLMATAAETAWQLDVVERALADALDAAGGDQASTVRLGWIDVRRLLGEHLAARRGRNDFFRGGITVTSMIPLRWVPFRVVCLLGMDQSALSGGYPAGDDLVQAPALVGDRDKRGDLRQSLLEAVMAAHDHLLVIRDGHNPRTNQEVPAAVAVAELRESVLGAVSPSHRPEAAACLEVDHPCHPFDDRCFLDGGLVDGIRWSFATGDLEGARARRHRRRDKEAFLSEPLPPMDDDIIDLADLQAFFEDPTAAFLRQRLGVRMPRSNDRPESTLPVHLGGLAKWQLGDRLLRAYMEGLSVEAWMAYERGCGTVLPGSLGDQVLDDVVAQVDELVEVASHLGVGTDRLPSVDIDIRLSEDARIVGSIPLALVSGDPGTARLTYSREKSSQRVRAWLDVMALSVAHPVNDWRSVVVCRGQKAGEVVALDYRLAPPAKDPPTPRECLDLAVALYRRGTVEPLPLFPKLSSALCFKPGSNMAAIWRSYPGSPAGKGEGESAAVELVHGRCDVEDILALPWRPGDPGSGSESSRARRLARALYVTVASSLHERRSEPAEDSGGR